MGDGRDAGAQAGHDFAKNFQSGVKGVEQGAKDVKDGNKEKGETEMKDGLTSVRSAMKAFGDEMAADASNPAKRSAALQAIKDDLSKSDDPAIQKMFGNAEILGYDPEHNGIILKANVQGQDQTVVLGSDLKIYKAAAQSKDAPRESQPDNGKGTPRSPDFDPDGALGDKYNKVGNKGDGTDKTPLPKEAEEQVKKDLEEYRKLIDSKNFSFDIQKGEGPVPAMERIRNQLHKDIQSGKIKEDQLTPQQKELLGVDTLKEGRRIRDRDFNDPDFVKAHQKYGGDGKIYAVKDDNAVKRWSDAEVKQMMDAKEAQLRSEAAKKVEAQRQAEAEKQRQAEAEKQRQAEIERQKREQANKPDVATAIDKSVPSEDIIKKAQTASGIDGDPKDIREKMKAQIASEVQKGTLDANNLPNPPRVGTVFVGTGAVTPEQLQAGLDKQAELKAKGGNVPRIGDILKDMYKDRADAIDKAGKFYDVMRSESIADQKTPSTEVIQKAQASAPVDGAGTPDDIHTRLRTQVAQDVLDGSVKAQDIGKIPTNEEVYVGLGVISPDELKAARTEQAKRAADAKTKNQPEPSTNDVVKDMYKDRKDKFAAADEYAKALQAEQQAADRARQDAEQRQKDLAAQVDKSVPDEDTVKTALDKAKIDAKPADVRQGMKAQMAQDVADKVLSPDDLSKGPTLESALVGTGALTPDELKAAREQAKKDNADTPDLSATLQKMYADKPDKLNQIKAATDFYTALKGSDSGATDADIDKAVPQQDAIQAGLTKAKVDGDPAQIRDGLKAQMAQDLKDGVINKDDLADGAYYDAFLTATGALTPDELKAAREEQAKRADAAKKDGKDEPDYVATLNDMFKDKPDKVAKIKAATDLYNAMQPAESPPADDPIDKSVPDKDAIKGALDKAKISADPDQVREAMKTQMAADVKAGLLKPDDAAKGPTLDDALVATGALTADELNAAREQAKKDNATAPDLGKTLQTMYKDNADKLAKIKAAADFLAALQAPSEPPAPGQ